MAPNEPQRKPGRPKRADAFNGAPPEKFDHDGDGLPGGSKPKHLPEFELSGLFAEAFEAYDMRDDRIRFDSKGRKWTFRLGATNDQSELHLTLTRLNDERTDKISTALIATEMGSEFIEASVRALDVAL